VGFCSYLLIGFWYTDEAKAFAGRKAFITNRIGDFGFVTGMMLLTLLVGAYEGDSRATESFKGASTNASNAKVLWNRSVDPSLPMAGEAATGPLSYRNLMELSRTLGNESFANSMLSAAIPSGPLQGRTYGGVMTVILLLFLLGAAGKSAQIPLYVWLPDAMAGPTPVSALIHAATVVTAGVYLFCRISFLLVLSPTAMAAVALVGAFTALLAALIAFAQDDIKKVLAFSTVSQLGFMFMGVGMGVFWAAVLHLVTHAFFKACLFLGAGSVMHGNADETDIKKLGGLRHEMRWTWVTFMVATLAITGVLPLSGFFSKDAILHGIHETTLKDPVLGELPWVSKLVWGLGLLSALCTAFYMSRLYILTFEGKRSKDARVPRAHESAFPMTFPLVVLAVLSIVAMVHGWPQQWLRPFGVDLPHDLTVMQNYLRPPFELTDEINAKTGFLLVEDWAPWWGYLIAWTVALLGAGAAAFAYLRYFPSVAGQPAPALALWAKRVAQNKFCVDELYEAVIIKPIRFTANVLYSVLDAGLIDKVAVGGTAQVTKGAGWVLRKFQTGNAQTYAAWMALALSGSIVYALVWVLK
jgi:NADH-quinone oxidoreductase subunit L